MRFFGLKKEFYLRVTHTGLEGVTTVHEKVEDGCLYRSLERQLPSLDSRFVGKFDGTFGNMSTKGLDRGYFLWSGLHISITFRRLVASETLFDDWFQIYRYGNHDGHAFVF